MIRAFKNYFGITKKEWNGMVVLVIIIFIVLAAPYVFQYFHKGEVMDLKDFNKALAQLRAGSRGLPDDGTDYTGTDTELNRKDAHPIMFKFNPNGLSVEQWKKLGLSQKQINGIKNYENKGGHFYTKADVQKMYTLTLADYTRMELYIDLPQGELKAIKKVVIVELNTADSAKLTELRGIGPSFASRIIRYRTQLGGFYNKDQLMEIYGIDSTKYKELAGQVTVNSKKINKIVINNALVDDLRRFPYLNFKQMNAIVEYRKQHGNYKSIGDLHDIALLNDGILRKIAPYLNFK